MSDYPSENQVMDWNIHNDHTDQIEPQEANEMAEDNAPSITVLGKLKTGKLVRADWNNQTYTLSDRTIAAFQGLGLVVNDDESNYLF
ncbi:MAG TPA: hypothetical protein VNB49_10490 [Candidatus Dormibacteraeota bacterium]|nr:hypothetical protein [Candidatus Dormibacteraeota bacterium]